MREYPTQQLLEDIAQALTPEAFDAAGMKPLADLDSLNTSMIEEHGTILACRAGCSICCSLRVDTFAHEIFLIARHIRARFSPEASGALLARLGAHSTKVTQMTPFAHATTNLQCAMLVDGRCSVYSVRPHSCRRHHSMDVAACQFTYDHPTDLETPAAHDRDLFRALTEAMRQNIEAYAELGYDHTFYELGSALHEALTDAAAWERWQAKEQAFLTASVTPSE